MNPPPLRVLFVCTGNTCRSPMAEVILRQLLERRGLKAEVSSAGTGAVEGAPASEGSLLVALEAGLDLSSHRARSLTPALARASDLILTMSARHRDQVVQLGAGHPHVLGEYAGRPAADADVDDPYGADLDSYRRTFHQLESLIGAALPKIELEQSGGRS